MHNVSYTPNAFIGWRFYEHVKFGLKTKIQQHEKNLLEKAGDFGLWPLENLPKKVWALVRDPRIVTLALTTFALYAVTFAFYPSWTLQAMRKLVTLVPLPTREQVKFGCYISIVSQIVSAALRAEGRFCNKALREAWYNGEYKSSRRSEDLEPCHTRPLESSETPPSHL